MSGAPRPRSALSMSMTDLVRSTMGLPSSRHGPGQRGMHSTGAGAFPGSSLRDGGQSGDSAQNGPREGAARRVPRRSGTKPGSFRPVAPDPADALPSIPAPSPSKLRRQSSHGFAILAGFGTGGDRQGEGNQPRRRPSTTRPSTSAKPRSRASGKEQKGQAQVRPLHGSAHATDPLLSGKAQERLAACALPHELAQNASYRSFLASDRWTSFTSDRGDGGSGGEGGGSRGNGPRSASPSRSSSRARASAGRDLLAVLPPPQQALIGEAAKVAQREVVRLALAHGPEHTTTAAAAERLSLLLGASGDTHTADSVETDLAGYVAQRASVAPDRASLQREADAAREAMEAAEREARRAAENAYPGLQSLLSTMNGYAKVTNLLLRRTHQLIAANDSAEVATHNRRAYTAFFHTWQLWQAQSSHDGHLLPQWRSHWNGAEPQTSTDPVHATLYDLGDLHAAVDALLGVKEEDTSTRRVLDGCLGSLRAYPRGADYAGEVHLTVDAPGGRVVIGEGATIAYRWRNPLHEDRPHLDGDWIGLFAHPPSKGSKEEEEEEEGKGVEVSPGTLVAWLPVPDEQDEGTVTFTAAPVWAGLFAVQYFLQRKWIPRGEPARGVCEPLAVTLRVRPKHVCGAAFDVGFEIAAKAEHSPLDWIAVMPRRGHGPPGWTGGPVARQPVPAGGNSGTVRIPHGPAFPGQYTVQYRLGAWHDAVAAATGPVAFAMVEEPRSLLAQQRRAAVRVCVITDDATCPAEADAIDDTVRPRVERAIEREYGLPCAVVHLRMSSLGKDPTLMQAALHELHCCAPLVFPLLGPDPPAAAATPLPDSVLAVAPWMAPYTARVRPGASLLELACGEAFSMPYRATGTANYAARLLRIVRPHRSRHLLGVAPARTRPAHKAVEALAASLASSMALPPVEIGEAEFATAAADCLTACIRAAWVRRAVLPTPGTPPHVAFADAWADIAREATPVFRLDAAARTVMDTVTAALAQNDLSITLARPLALHGGPGSGRTAMARRIFVALMRRHAPPPSPQDALQRPPWHESIAVSWTADAGPRAGGDGQARRFVLLHVAAAQVLGTDSAHALATVILGLLADQGISAAEMLDPESLREACRRPRASRAVTVLSLLADALARSPIVVCLIVDNADTLVAAAAAESAFALAWLPRKGNANFRVLLVCRTDGAVHDVAAASSWPSFAVPTPAAADQAALVARWSEHRGGQAEQRLEPLRQRLLRAAAPAEGDDGGDGGAEGKEEERETGGDGGEGVRPCRSHALLRTLVHFGVELGNASSTFLALVRRQDAPAQELLARWLQDARLQFPPTVTALRALLLARDGLSEPELLSVLVCVHGVQSPEQWGGDTGREAAKRGQQLTARDLPALLCRYSQQVIGALTFAAQGVHRVRDFARPPLTAALAALDTGNGAPTDAGLRRAIITAFRAKLTLPRGSLEVPHQLFVLGQAAGAASPTAAGSGDRSSGGSGGKSPHTELCELAASLGFAARMQRRHPGVLPRLVRRLGREKEVVNAMAASLEAQCGIRYPMELARRYRKLMLPAPAAQNSIDPATFRERGSRHVLCLARQADELGLEAAALALYDEALALAFNLQDTTKIPSRPKAAMPPGVTVGDVALWFVQAALARIRACVSAGAPDGGIGIMDPARLYVRVACIAKLLQAEFARQDRPPPPQAELSARQRALRACFAVEELIGGGRISSGAGSRKDSRRSGKDGGR